MIRFLLLVCCLLTVNGSSRMSQADSNHDQWLQGRYVEAVSIKEGMTRADLLRVFRMDGGLQSFLPRRYVLKSSNLIKVDVEFEGPPNVKGKIAPEDSTLSTREGFQTVPNDKLKIKHISKPYLEPSDSD